MRKILIPVTALLLILSAGIANAELKAMTSSEMKSETAQAGLTSFTTDANTVRMFMDIHMETWTEIDSMKTGYYPVNGSAGWDQNWQNVKFGTSMTNQMKMDGLVFKADFDSLTTDGTTKPSLKRIVIGTNRLVGTMQADFQSFSGVYNPALTTDTQDDSTTEVYKRSAALGQTAFNFNSPESETSLNKKDNMGFFLVISTEGSGKYPGIQAVLGYNELSIPSNAFNAADWWDK